MSAGEDFITSDQLKDELNQACSTKSISSDIIKVDENSKEYKRLKSSRQGIKNITIPLKLVDATITIVVVLNIEPLENNNPFFSRNIDIIILSHLLFNVSSN